MITTDSKTHRLQQHSAHIRELWPSTGGPLPLVLQLADGQANSAVVAIHTSMVEVSVYGSVSTSGTGDQIPGMYQCPKAETAG